MKKAVVIFKLTAFLFVLLFVAGVSDAQKLAVKPIGKTLEIPNDKDQNGAIIKVNGEIQKFEPSGVEPIGGGKYLLVANDNDNKDGLALKIVEASTGQVIKTLSEKIQKPAKNPKWEALAKDAEGNYYVIGSHNHADDAGKLANRSSFFRFRLVSEWETDPMKFAIDLSSVKELNVKKAFTDLKIYDSSPLLNKLKIEGLAVRGRGCSKQLFIGLRGDPFGKNITRVYSADLRDMGNDDDFPPLSLKPWFKFDAGKPDLKAGSTDLFKLSSLEYVEKLKGFLILTSTENDQTNAFSGNALWFAGDESIAAAKTDADGFKELSLKPIRQFDADRKAEGIAVMPPVAGKITTAVIVFDNDEKKDGALEVVEITGNR